MQTKSPNLFAFKGIVFYVFVASIVAAIVGPLFFPSFYYVFCIISFAYALFKYIQMICILIYVNFKYDSAMKSYQQRKIQKYCSIKEITHVFILPNFNEQQQLIRESIQQLANHSRAKNYCLILAMEKHEINSATKAKKFVDAYADRFRFMSYTIHQLLPGQSKSKASNINWSVRSIASKLIENYVNMDTVMITIMDSDSLIPQAYVDQLQCHLEDNYDNRHLFIYQPPQMFTKNQNQVSFFVRIIDNLMSAMQCAQLYSVCNYTIGVSNYSLSYRLLQRIGFWDTCIFSKGEDSRITSKALWKTNGEIKTCPIYIPINQMSLATHEGIWADFKARMEQAKRHCQDQVELSYNFVNMLNSPIKLSKKLYTFFVGLQLYIMPIAIPITFLVVILQQILKVLPMAPLDANGNAFMLFNNINTVIMLIIFFLFQFMKRRASRKLYGITKMNFWNLIQTPLLQLPIVILFGFVPMVIASFNLLTNNFTVTVAKKKSLNLNAKSSLTQSESLFQSQEIQQNSLIKQQKIELTPRL